MCHPNIGAINMSWTPSGLYVPDPVCVSANDATLFEYPSGWTGKVHSRKVWISQISQLLSEVLVLCWKMVDCSLWVSQMEESKYLTVSLLLNDGGTEQEMNGRIAASSSHPESSTWITSLCSDHQLTWGGIISGGSRIQSRHLLDTPGYLVKCHREETQKDYTPQSALGRTWNDWNSLIDSLTQWPGSE